MRIQYIPEPATTSKENALSTKHILYGHMDPEGIERLKGKSE